MPRLYYSTNNAINNEPTVILQEQVHVNLCYQHWGTLAPRTGLEPVG